MTVPQVRVLIAGLLERVLAPHAPDRLRRNTNRRLRRNEEARLYHWHRLNRALPFLGATVGEKVVSA